MNLTARPFLLFAALAFTISAQTDKINIAVSPL